jgi:Ca2+/Na+ antiporter
MAFWGGLSMMKSDSELNKFIYCCINLGMIAVGAMLSRRVFAVFGGFGVAGYLYHLADSVFKDSMLFPLALTFLGLGVIYMGVKWQRHEEALGRFLRGVLPQPLRELIERG